VEASGGLFEGGGLREKEGIRADPQLQLTFQGGDYRRERLGGTDGWGQRVSMRRGCCSDWKNYLERKEALQLLKEVKQTSQGNCFSLRLNPGEKDRRMYMNFWMRGSIQGLSNARKYIIIEGDAKT